MNAAIYRKGPTLRGILSPIFPKTIMNIVSFPAHQIEPPIHARLSHFLDHVAAHGFLSTGSRAAFT
jgi:hypothetical protein